MVTEAQVQSFAETTAQRDRNAGRFLSRTEFGKALKHYAMVASFGEPGGGQVSELLAARAYDAYHRARTTRFTGTAAHSRRAA